MCSCLGGVHIFHLWCLGVFSLVVGTLLCVWVSLGCLLDLSIFCGGLRRPKVTSRSWPHGGPILVVFGHCRRFADGALSATHDSFRAVHVWCERGAFILPRKTQHAITCWVIPCARIPAVCVFWDVFGTAASLQKASTKGRGQILGVFRICRRPA